MIKTYALSKIVFPASVLQVPTQVVVKLKEIIYQYLWGKRDKIKRTCIIQKKKQGGLDMVDIDSFLISLKAVWASRIQNAQGKWVDILKYYLQKSLLDFDYVWKTSFRTTDSFPIIKLLPEFYQDVILGFNKAKCIKPFNLLSKSEVMQLPIWGSEYFKVRNTCLFFKGWLKKGILYVKDLINIDGNIKSDDELYKCTNITQNKLQDVYVIKNYVIKKIKKVDTGIAPYVKIKPLTHIMYKNHMYELHKSKSKLYYEMISSKLYTRGHMESIYSRECGFENRINLWSKIYVQKICDIKIPKLSEFNFKLLHNIVPCGKILCKWQKDISEKCEYCDTIESTKHMLYDCPHVSILWQIISEVANVNIKWKQILCGYPSYHVSKQITCLNYLTSIVIYAIFKVNSRCKFDKKSYRNVNLKDIVKQNIMYYTYILQQCNVNIEIRKLFVKICDKL